MEGGGGGSSEAAAADSWTTRRAREQHQCSFCKRGFTNAQALGGHMNIHRKDRSAAAKASSSRGTAAARQPPAGGAQLDGDNQDVVDLELRLGY